MTITMENVENETVKTEVSRSYLSDWSGAPVTCENPVLEYVTAGDRVVPDDMDQFKRGFALLADAYFIPYLAYGPASAPLSLYHIVTLLKQSSLISDMFVYYEGIAYDSVELRVTTCNPKGIAGGFVVGVYPFAIWNNTPFSSERVYHDQNIMTRQHLMLAPQSHLVTYSSAEDVVFDIPWQYNVPYLSRQFIAGYSDGSSVNQLWPGTPVIFFNSIGATFVSSQTMPARIHVFAKFKNLRMVGPRVLGGPQNFVEDFEMLDLEQQGYVEVEDMDLEEQSGVETLVTAAATMASAIAVDTGSEILTDVFSSSSSKTEDKVTPGTYENPQAVQMAYVGDSTKYGPPQNLPIFRTLDDSPSKHKVSELLSQPQYLETFNTGTSRFFFANPTAQRGVSDFTGDDQNCTYFRFFSQAASYWRGTIIFDFVIMGHPMVETEYTIKISYPPFAHNTSWTYSQNSLLRGVCSGVYRISVPMPFMTPLDHMRVIDEKSMVIADLRNNSSSIVSATVDVVSTMLDVPPVIPVAVFVRAGEDFEFLQPYAVGLGYVNNPTEDLFDMEGYEPQCGLPPVSEVFETRAKTQKSVSQMVPIIHIEDFMSIWSRSLPYQTYNGDMDPIVILPPAIAPYWYPQNDTTTAHTLGGVNSWWVTNDYVSYFSSMFLYFKGSIAFKILCKPGSGYKYVTLNSGSVLRQPGRSTFTYVASQLPPEANLAYGTVATDLGGQPVLEVTIPLRSSLKWGFCNPEQMSHVMGGFYSGVTLRGDVRTNVVLHTESSDLEDALYRKAGGDFNLSVRTLLPPPTLWMAKGNLWS
jgi:hypothetical protein